MKKILDKLLNVDRKVLIFLATICIIGIVTGSLFMVILSSNDKEQVFASLEQFIADFGHLNMKIELTNNLIINLLYILGIWILGISVIGIPIVICLIFIKSFLISFTIASFIMRYKTKGILLGLVYIMPHQIVNLLTLIYVGVYAIKLSLYLIETIFKKKNLNFKNITNRYLMVLGFAVIVLIISSLYETFIMPSLLNKIITFLT